MMSIGEVQKTAAVGLGALLDAGDGAVVTLEAGQMRLAAHRAVLAARSPVLAAMFEHDTLESSSGTVSIPDVEGPVLRELVAYLYTQRAPHLPDMAPQLLAAADKYRVLGLKAYCEQLVARELSVENAAAAAVLAMRHSCPQLMDAAADFIKANLQVMLTQGWKDTVYHQPDVVLEVTRRLTDPPLETSNTASAGTHQPPHSPPPGASPAAAPELSLSEEGRRLIEAAKNGAVEKLQDLLTAGVEVGVWDKFRNGPLHWAAYKGHTAAVRLLLGASADPNARGQNDRTPLHRAAQHGHTEVVAALIEAGADKWSRDEFGLTPLEVARSDHFKNFEDMLT